MGTSERSSTSLRLFLPICLMYYYSLQIEMGFKTKKNIYSPYLTGNTLHTRYRAQPVNVVMGNRRCLL
jgi:hypothetical protein